jgi:hypothetical protein
MGRKMGALGERSRQGLRGRTAGAGACSRASWTVPGDPDRSAAEIGRRDRRAVRPRHPRRRPGSHRAGRCAGVRGHSRAAMDRRHRHQAGPNRAGHLGKNGRCNGARATLRQAIANGPSFHGPAAARIAFDGWRPLASSGCRRPAPGIMRWPAAPLRRPGRPLQIRHAPGSRPDRPIAAGRSTVAARCLVGSETVGRPRMERPRPRDRPPTVPLLPIGPSTTQPPSQGWTPPPVATRRNAAAALFRGFGTGLTGTGSCGRRIAIRTAPAQGTRAASRAQPRRASGGGPGQRADAGSPRSAFSPKLRARCRKGIAGREAWRTGRASGLRGPAAGRKEKREPRLRIKTSPSPLPSGGRRHWP